MSVEDIVFTRPKLPDETIILLDGDDPPALLWDRYTTEINDPVRAMLAVAMGEEGVCTDCEGSAEDVNGKCWTCEDSPGYLIPDDLRLKLQEWVTEHPEWRELPMHAVLEIVDLA